MNSFFSTTATNESPEIVKALVEKDYQQLESCGETSNILIDKINKTFWFCNDQCMQRNKSIIESLHKQKIEQVTLKEIQSWMD